MTTLAEVRDDLAKRVEGWSGLFGENTLGPIRITPGRRDVEVSGSRLSDGGTIHTAQDVTERQNAERLAIQSQRLEAVGQMTAGICARL